MMRVFVLTLEKMSMKVGILCHGRHTGTKDWEGVVWGREGKMGQIPTALAVMRDHERMGNEVVAFVFGTGASERDGVPEAQVMVDYMMDHFPRLPSEFPTFADINPAGLVAWRRVISEIVIVETTSKNTTEEVIAAMRIFEALGVDMVVDVTCRTHAARCRRDVDTVMEQSSFCVPSHRVMVVSSETHYAGVESSAEVGVLEPPHRGDTPENFHEFYELMMKMSSHFYSGRDRVRGIITAYLGGLFKE